MSPSIFKPIKAGFMRDRIIIQVPQIIQPDGGGGGEYGWNNVVTLWAQVKTDNGDFTYRNNNYLQEAQMMGRQIYSIITRYNKPLTTNMRVIFKYKELLIRSIVNIDELNWTVKLLCEQEGNGEY